MVLQDRPGQAGNRLPMALVSAGDVDPVARNGFGLRMPAYGILEHQDAVGLNLGLSILE